MTNGSSAPRIRFVKCPRCREVLQESDDIPMYRCGGCGLILQAKYRRNEMKVMGQKSDELPIPPNEISSASDDKDSGGVRSPPDAENSVEMEGPRDQRISVDDVDFVPKEEMSVFTDDDQLGMHSYSNEEDNGERDEESIGIRLLAELESHEYGGSSPIEERNLDTEAGVEGLPVPRRNCGEETKGSDVRARKMVSAVSSLVVGGVDKPEEATNTHAFDRKMSAETITSTEYVDPVTDFSGTLAETPRSPASKFQGHHNGDLPSNGERETNNLKGYGKEAKSTLTRERPSQEKYRANHNSEIRNPERIPRASFPSSNGDGFIRADGRDRAGIIERPAQFSEERYWRRSDRGELQPRIPVNHSQQRSYCDYRASSNQQLLMYSRFNSSIHSSDGPTHTEREKVKLLRMVHELEDQLKGRCDLDGIPSERMAHRSHWREKPGSFYYSQDLMEEGYLQMGLPAISRRDKRDGRWRYRSQYPKGPFSAEITETSRKPKNHYFHPVNWRQSEPLPPLAAAYNGKFYGIRHDKGICSPYSSCPSSPQCYMDYGSLPYGKDTRSDDEIYDNERDYDKYREGRPTMQSHVMAAAGGAPWIICSHCNRMLQLPTDFLLLKKKCHRLRCGSCSAVLKFSLQNRRQLVPYVHHTGPPPPSEAHECGETLTLDPCSNGFMQAKTVSHSDDIGTSYSAEGYPARLAMLHDIGNPLDESSVAEELHESGPAPLHRLMGYSSVSQIFRGQEATQEGATSAVVKRR